MKYKPVNVEEVEVNVSKESPLKKAFTLMAVSVLIIVSAYLAVGLVAELAVTKLPPKMQQNFGNMLSKPYVEDEDTVKDDRLQAILDEMIKGLPHQEREYQYNIYLLKKDYFNAMAAPGGNIFVYEGLMKEAENDEELTFVVAHELGHIVYKDPLKAFARRYSAAIITQLFFGNDKLIQSVINNSSGHLELKFSRDAEVRADKFATEMVCREYGSADGGISFMEKLEKKHKLKLPAFMYYFSTHPATHDRIKVIREHAKKF